MKMEDDRDERQKNLRVAQFPRQQHREGVVMVLITEGTQRKALNEVPISWSLLRPLLLPAPDAAPNKNKTITAFSATIKPNGLQLSPCVMRGKHEKLSSY